MALLGELAVNLVANTKGLIKGFKKAGSLTQQFSKRLKVGLVAGATAAAAGMAAFAKQQLAVIDALAKSSALLGINIEDLQKFHLAAKLGGVETSTFNTAIQRMVRRSAEAQQGNKNLQATFSSLGLSLGELSALEPAELFEKVGDGLNKIGDSGEKVRLAMGVFDTEGVKLINVYGEGLREAAEQQEKFGAVTEEQAETVQMLNDSWAKLWDGLKRLGQQSLLSVADGLIKVVGLLEKTIGLVAEAQKGFELWLTDQLTANPGANTGAVTAAERAAFGPRALGSDQGLREQDENNARAITAEQQRARMIDQADREWESIWAGGDI